MGEIAEMMLDGTMCECCGEFIDTGSGFPTRCTGCGGDGIIYDFPAPKTAKSYCNNRCSKCGKKCRGEIGLNQHIAAKHP